MREYVLEERLTVRRVVEALGAGASGFLVFLLMRVFGGGHLDLVAWLVGVGGLVAGLVRGFRREEVLRVDDDGVRFGDVTVPWASVWQLVLLRPGPPGDEPIQVGLRLKRAAPLPDGLDALVTDPSDPLAIPETLRSAVTDREIDGDALLAVATLCAPPHVGLVDREGERERVLPRGR